MAAHKGLVHIPRERWMELYWAPESGHPTVGALARRLGVRRESLTAQLVRHKIPIRGGWEAPGRERPHPAPPASPKERAIRLEELT